MKVVVKLDFANVTFTCDDDDNFGMIGWDDELRWRVGMKGWEDWLSWRIRLEG